MPKDNSLNNQDEWLASFSDLVLTGKMDALPADVSDSELSGLAETILRLERAFPRSGVDSIVLRNIQRRVLDKSRSAQQKKTRLADFLRLDWLAQQFKRPQSAFALVVIAIVGILIWAVPFMGGGQLVGSATSDFLSGIVGWLVLGILIVALIWLARRKS